MGLACSMDLLPKALALVLRCDSELTEGPGAGLSEQRNLRFRFWLPERNGSNDYSLELGDKPMTRRETFGCVFGRLMRGPISEAACCIRSIRRADKHGEGSDIVRCQDFTTSEQ